MQLFLDIHKFLKCLYFYFRSLYKQLVQWYRDLYWPWDWDETILGLRYSLTCLLLFAAFISLIYTFFAIQKQNSKEEL